jgi:hypothetical protein
VSGVDVPKLGSIKDVIARQYLARQASKEISIVKLIAHVASSNDPSDSWKKSIGSMFADYVNLALFLDTEVDRREEEMQKDFEHWRKVRPTIVVSKDKKSIKVKGIS